MMKVVVYRGPRQLGIKKVPVPKIGVDEVLLKIRAVGICGTDLHIFNGGTTVKPGTIIGHEFSGDVVAVGKNVSNVRVGDRAVAEHVIVCGSCYYCRRGKPNLCLRAEVIGMDRPGALAEYVKLPASLVYPFPKKISYDQAALIEPLTIALYAAANSGFLLEKRVAVVGQGPIGLLLDQVLRNAGAHVIGVDVQANRLAFARQHGWVTETLNPSSRNFKRDLKELTLVGVDASFEAVGKDATAELCIDMTRRDGDVYLLGVFEKPATLDMMRVIKKELHIHGSWTCAFSFPAAIDMLNEQRVDLKSLITHRYTVDNVQQAFQDSLGYSDQRIKTVITF